MNVIKDVSKLMAPTLSSLQLPSCYFTSLSQAIACANRFFMEGLNAQIIAKGKNTFLVVPPDIAREMHPQGFQLIYGNEL
ncbi:hypothetical protein ACFPMF_09220 [Larkinella bovis]|uniref:Uncharacterized protein n=1 Tax=Larkinella bovis TaxID=683041 RepID=A0ABW0IAW6_9BACT